MKYQCLSCGTTMYIPKRAVESFEEIKVKTFKDYPDSLSCGYCHDIAIRCKNGKEG